jgi:hypothetical protein
MTQRAQAGLSSAVDTLAAEQAELAALEEELKAELVEIVDAWEAKADAIEEMEIPLEANDVDITEIRLVWVPVA